jgi:polyhydroxyalkanoate synthesis repressor PhaR
MTLDMDDAARYMSSVPRTPSPDPPRLVKRYGNRKLYDPARRTYVTLEALGAHVAAGGDIEVLDQRTEEDITSLVLAQILLEGLRQSTSRIPRQVLTRLVRLAAGPSPRWGEWPDAPEVAGKAWAEVERMVGRLLARGRLSLEDALSLREDLGQVVHRLVSEAQSGVEARLRALLRPGDEGAGRSLDVLRSRLDAFEAYLDTPVPPARPPAKRRRPRAQA